MNTLVFPLPLFQRLLQALAEQPRRVAFVRVGVHHAPPDSEWLTRDFTLSPPDAPVPSQGLFFRIALTAPPLTDLLIDPLTPSVVGHVYLGIGDQRGHLWGVVRHDDDALEPLHRLSLVGAGMYQIQIPNPNDQIPNTNHPFTPSPLHPFMVYSRTIGALGGEDVWRRLVSLHPCLIGCGRTGSLVATTLARLGVRDLTLIDPDIVEAHNLGEMDAVTAADIGKPKVEAVSRNVSMGVWKCRSMGENDQKPLPPYPHTPTLPYSITDPTALNAAKACDVLFCCADNDAARLTTALVATLYHKVLIDIGTGIFFDLSPTRPYSHTPIRRQLGADIRLVLPGDGCLLCVGNLSRYQQAVEDLCNHRSPAALQDDWRQQRAGSLRTLNQIAAHLGVQMLQDLVAERIRESLWARVEFDEAGRMTVNYPPTHQPANSPTCPLCAKAGLGDEALYFINEEVQNG